MYKVIQFFLCLIILISSGSELKYYELAFDKIKKSIDTISFIGNSNHCIRVSEETISAQSIVPFFDSEKVINIGLVDSIKRNYEKHKTISNYNLSSLSECIDTVGVLYFSNLVDETILTAEIIKGNHFEKKREEIYTFDTSIIFLIEFNEKKEIVNFLSKRIHNN